MLGYEHLETFGEEVEDRQPDRQAVGAMQEDERRAGAAPQHPDIDVPDLVLRFRTRHELLSLCSLKQSTIRPFVAIQGTFDVCLYRAISSAPFRRAVDSARRM